jgi:hypothetical protein
VNPDISRANRVLREQHRDLSEERMEPVYYHEALTWIRAHPLDWLGLEARKAFYTVVPAGPSYTAHSSAYFVTSIVSYLLLLPLAIVGFLGLTQRGALPSLWLLLASSIVICLLFFPQERFRIPGIDPVLVICAGAALGAPRRVAA